MIMSCTARLATLFAVVFGLASSHSLHTFPDLLRYDRATTKLDGSVSISATPALLVTSGDWITVSWENAGVPSTSDWVGVFTPPVDGSIDLRHHAPVKYQYANYSGSYMNTGVGSLRFQMINMRGDMIVGFFTGGSQNPVLLAVSDIIQFQNYNEPLQGHLVLGDDPTEVILIWVTQEANAPQVLWGTQSNAYTSSKMASSSTYKAGDMCGSPATDFGFLDPGMLHQVTMDNLVPGERYFYVFGDPTFGLSQEFSFTASPITSPDSTVRIVVYGDMGNGQVDDSLQIMTAQQPALNTTNLIYSQIDQTDLVLHIGDISYARGYASVWEEFFHQVQPIAARAPYMVCIGNHERDFPNSGSYYNGTDSNGECGVPYEKRFPMPTPAQDQPWFGFDFGSVHFVLMSTEHRFDSGSAQLQYLDDHLSTVDRSKTPWLIFAGHRPMYIDSTNWALPDGDQPVALLLRAYVEPLLKKYQVDVAFWGHHHSYQRSCPVFGYQCMKGATTHIVVGMGGQGLSQNIDLHSTNTQDVGALMNSHKSSPFVYFEASVKVEVDDAVADTFEPYPVQAETPLVSPG
eukprot:Em0012g643a